MSPEQFRRPVEPVDADLDHVRGPTGGPVILEYGDYECPYSRQAFRAIEQVEQHARDGIRFAFRHFPLEEVHPHALLAAEVAEVAGAQGKFWDMHDILYDNQLHLKAASLRSYAERLQLDMARYGGELDDHIYLQRIREHAQGGRGSGVRGTPTFFVNRNIQDVSFGMHLLFEAVETAVRR